MRTALGAALLLVALPACDDSSCPAARAELRSLYEPYGDRCEQGDACLSGQCDAGRTGACRCESDGECRSGLCLDGLCANPGHDRRLTPGLAQRGAAVRPLCPGVDAGARRRSPDCARVLAFLEADPCDACTRASLRLCACRTGAALHACLLDAARSDADVGDPAQERLCEVVADDVDCGEHLGPAGAACGDASAGPDECLSGLCRDADPVNNATPEGDHPEDWICVDPCAADLDCRRGWFCDPDAALSNPPAGHPYMCRERP